MEINLVYIFIFVVIVFLFLNLKKKENMENPCQKINPADMAEAKIILDELKLNDNYNALTSEKYAEKINKLTYIFQKMDAKCINASFMNQEVKKKYCNKEQKDEIMKTLNLIDNLIDRYGFNVFILLDHYENVLEDLEKNCYGGNQAEIIKKIKNIIRKLSLIISVDKNIKEKLNYKNL
jgi:hypothetical protein